MDYKFLDSNINIENLALPDSDKINTFLKKNNQAEIIKALEFLKSDNVFMYIHRFLGTGKRQFINYITEFLDKDVIKLEYYCKASTVCDDILLSFTEIIEELTQNKNVNLNVKITTLTVKFQQLLSSIKRPFIIILHSLDDISNENMKLVTNLIESLTQNKNVKIVISTRGLVQNVAGNLNADCKIFLKHFLKKFLKSFWIITMSNAKKQRWRISTSIPEDIITTRLLL